MKNIIRYGMHLGLGLACAMGAAAVFAQTYVQNPHAIVFSRAMGDCAGLVSCRKEYFPWGAQTLPQSPADAGSWLALFGATAKSGNTQVLRFKFRSEGLFTQQPGAHVAIAGRHEGGPVRYNRGRGFVMGNINIPSGCVARETGAAYAQPEIWYDSATESLPAPFGTETTKDNDLLRQCSAQKIYDWRWYSVEMHVADTGFAYWITDMQDGLQVEARYVPVPLNGTINSRVNLVAQGIAFAVVFADGGSWRVTFQDVATGWF